MPSDKDEGNIRTYLRIRPSKRGSGFFRTSKSDDARLIFDVPLEVRSGDINNTKTKYDFLFNGVLPMDATQEEVFAKIGKEAVLNVLEGYNSTIFAYGQTGSGKTFTITGGAERYVDRGLIPRSLSVLFAEFKRRADVQYTCHVSYLEIYNNQGQDLLDPAHETQKQEDIKQVALLEDEEGNIHLRNLSMYLVATEEEALNYLFIGDTNRAISETAMNKASSRSHCIFTLSIEGRQVGSDKVLRSKLHLVDLAGSERVHKTNTTGRTLTEAKHINSSLLFLEMVIKALHEKATNGSRTHIPYRNSMMTSVLRDSLGGNCKTVMVATINPEADQTEESISTCRFAQRVSMIKNDAVVNEDLDPQLVIHRLKAQNTALQEEVNYLKGEGGEEGDAVGEKERLTLMQKCREYVDNKDPYAVLAIGKITLNKIKDCFAILKNLVLEAREGKLRPASHWPAHSARGRDAGSGATTDSGNDESSSAQIQALQAELQRRDSEIAVLVNMVKKGKRLDLGQLQGAKDQVGQSLLCDQRHTNCCCTFPLLAPSGTGPSQRLQRCQPGTASQWPHHQDRCTSITPPPPDRATLEEPQLAFAYFMEHHTGSKAIADNKEVLKKKFNRAKEMGLQVNNARSSINYLKGTIEQIRRERAMEGLLEGGSDMEDPEEAKYKREIEQEKKVYKESFQMLRDLKTEIEHIQKMLEKARLKLQADFDAWYQPLLKESHRQGPTAVWGTPPGSVDGSTSSEKLPPLPLTGHKGADEDIRAFNQAREELERRRWMSQAAPKT
ncbi:unnamed protein product [Chrysoparadoxa australica]